MAVTNHKDQCDKVVDYYNATQERYNNFYMDNENLAIHFGYYDKTATSHSASLTRMNQVLAEKAKINGNDYVLDAGCGVGGSSIWIAKNTGARVTGIALVEKQIKYARQFAKEKKIENQVNFEIQDFTNTNFESETFDVVWALESVCHTLDKSGFTNESFRLLKKGGRLVLADGFLKEGNLTAKESQAMEWIKGWSVPNLSRASEFQKFLKESGYGKIEHVDITENVLPCSRWIAEKGRAILDNNAFLNKDPSMLEVERAHAQSHVNQYAAMMDGTWKYGLIYAEK